MKFMVKEIGQTGLLISLCVLVSACNPDDFYPTEEFIEGLDAYCAVAKDENSCSSLNYCQPAYNESEEGEALVFSACVANPDSLPTTGGVEGSTTGGSTGGVDGSTTGGSTGGDDGSTTGGSTGGDDGSTTGGSTGGVDGSTTGGSTGGDDGSATGGSSGGIVIVPPTIEEAWQSKCANLDPKYMYVKKIVSKKETKRVSKVKVCHMSGSSSSHTIIIACPALKAHRQHDDYLGSCEQ